MSYDFNRSKLIGKTRKPAPCEQCGRTIDAGSAARYFSGKYDGSFYSLYAHIECHKAALEYAQANSLFGEEWPWFQHGEHDEAHDWLAEAHPIVAERLGWAPQGWAALQARFAAARLSFTPELPMDEARGQFLGIDKDACLWLLVWNPEGECWSAIGFEFNHPKPWPKLFQVGGEHAGRIVGHARLPVPDFEPGRSAARALSTVQEA